MHPDTAQSALRAAAVVPESVAQPAPALLLRIEAPDRRTPRGQWLAKGSRREKGINSVLGTYQFSCGGTASMVTASSVMNQLATPAASRDTNSRIVSGHAAWSHWHAISTSSLPASRHASPQYFFPRGTSHRQGMCAHFLVSCFAIMISSFPAPFNFSTKASRLLASR